jgi:hypothetical protein
MVNPTISLIGIGDEPECAVDINQEIWNRHSAVARSLNLAHENLVTKPAAERHLPTRDPQIGWFAQYSRPAAIVPVQRECPRDGFELSYSRSV